MTSYAERLAQELRNSYEGRDRDALERALRRMVATMHYTGPVEDRQRPSDCAKGKDCTCGRTIQRETCQERTMIRHRPHGTVDGDYCPECGWTCNVCTCKTLAARPVLDLVDPETLGSRPWAVVQARTQLTPECTRKLLGCECTTPEQRSQCMFRATA
jgi:hypothetical protein